jgi:hypothetical protein
MHVTIFAYQVLGHMRITASYADPTREEPEQQHELLVGTVSLPVDVDEPRDVVAFVAEQTLDLVYGR